MLPELIEITCLDAMLSPCMAFITRLCPQGLDYPRECIEQDTPETEITLPMVL